MLIITPVSYISISDNALCHSSVVSTSSQDQHPDTLGGGGSRRGLGELTGGQILLTAQYGGYKQQMLITGLAGGVRPLGQLFNVQ